MATDDSRILAGLTPAQADEAIAAKEAAARQLEDTLRVTRDEIKAAKAERKTLKEPAAAGDGEDAATASAGAAEASGKVGR